MTPTSDSKISNGEFSDAMLIEFYSDQHHDIPMDSALRLEINAALCTNQQLAARYAQLEQRMQELRTAHQSEHMPEATRLRLERNLARHERLQKKDRRPMSWRWLLAAAGAGAVMTIALQSLVVPTRDSPLVHKAGPEDAAVNAALDPLKPYSAHMLDAQMVLANLATSPRSEQQRLLDELIAQNRAFAQRAEAQGLADVKRVLQALEPVLSELSRAQASPERKQLLEQLDFETRVLANRWHANSAQSEQTKIDL